MFWSTLEMLFAVTGFCCVLVVCATFGYLYASISYENRPTQRRKEQKQFEDYWYGRDREE